MIQSYPLGIRSVLDLEEHSFATCQAVSDGE
jgi:hypothetical protein